MIEIKVRKGYIYSYLSPSGKYYIGQTINLYKRKSEHRKFKDKNSPIDRAIHKYGEKSFKFNILFCTKSRDINRLKFILNIMEAFYIKRYKKDNKNLYNILDGGTQGNLPIWDKDRRLHMRNVMLRRRANGFLGNKGRTMSSYVKEKLIASTSIKIIQYSLTGDFIARWNSISEASRSLNILHSSISNCLTGRSKTAGKYIWKYE